MDAWSIDVIISASQKGLGAPPGLSILIASQRALQASRSCWCHLYERVLIATSRLLRTAKHLSLASIQAGRGMLIHFPVILSP